MERAFDLKIKMAEEIDPRKLRASDFIPLIGMFNYESRNEIKSKRHTLAVYAYDSLIRTYNGLVILGTSLAGLELLLK